jgi:hypothetical protein
MDSTTFSTPTVTGSGTGERDTYVALIAMKLMLVATSWVSAYFAAKVLQDSYIDKVYMKRESPAALSSMVFTFLMFQVLFGAIVLVVTIAITYVVSPKTNPRSGVLKLAIFDILLSLTSTSFILLTIADVMQNKKYFNYRYEGLRAIRAMKIIMFRASIAGNVLPYFLMISDRVLKKTR